MCQLVAGEQLSALGKQDLVLLDHVLEPTPALTLKIAAL